MTDEDNHIKFAGSKAISILIISFIVYSIGVIPPILLFKVVLIIIPLQHVLFLIFLPFLLVFEFIFLLFSEIIVTSAVIYLFKIKYQEGVYDLNLKDKTFYKFCLFSNLELINRLIREKPKCTKAMIKPIPIKTL